MNDCNEYEYTENRGNTQSSRRNPNSKKTRFVPAFLLTCLHEWRVVLTRRPGALARPNVSPHEFLPGFSRLRSSNTCHPGNHADSQGTVEVEKRSNTLRRTCIFCCRRLVGVLVVCCCGLLDYGITARVMTSAVTYIYP